MATPLRMNRPVIRLVTPPRPERRLTGRLSLRLNPMAETLKASGLVSADFTIEGERIVKS